MTTYIIQLPADYLARSLVDGISAVVVEASTEAQAISVAKAAVGGDINSPWDNADVVAGDFGEAADYDLFLSVTAPGGGVPVFEQTFSADARFHVTSILLNAPGTGYTEGDIITAAAGTGGDVEATFTVVSVDETGAISNLTLLNPGSYAADVSGVGRAVTGGTGNDDATVNLDSPVGTFAGLLHQAQAALADTVTFANATVDMTTSVLTVAPDTDNHGTYFVVAKMLGLDRNGDASNVEIVDLVNTITHNGVAATELSVEFATPETFLAPKLLAVLKS